MTTDIGNDELLRCAELVGHRFADLELLKLALTHSSYSAEEPGEPSNERLEFLGDAVLGWVLADEMFRRHPDFHEGLLTDLRKSVVNAATLAEVARLSRGETTLRFRNRYLRASGDAVWLEWNARAVPDEGVIYAVARDVTERVRLEAELEKSRRDVEDFMENANVPLHSVDAGARTGPPPAGGGP